MANTKISAMADAVTLNATDQFPIARAGANYAATGLETFTYVRGAYSGLTISGSATTGAYYYGALGFSDTNLLATMQTSANSYTQIVAQNTSNGSAASADFVVNNDVGTASTFYGNFGMNSSGFTGSGSLNLPSAVYLTATSGELVLGTTTANGVRFVVNSGTSDAMAISSTGQVSLNGKNITLAGNLTTTGAFNTSLTQQVSGTFALPVASGGTLAVNGTATTFAASGTWTKLTTSTWVAYLLVGGGGQGGYGGNYAAASGGSGGGGGGAGGINFGIALASSFASSETITIGAGGTGAGNSGTPQGAKGGITSIGTKRYAGGGGGGGGGTVTSTSGGGGAAGASNGQASSGTTTGGAGFGIGTPTGGSGAAGSTPNTSAAFTSGSSGGGTTSAGVANAGGNMAVGTTGGGSGGGFAVGGAAQAGAAGGSGIIDGATSSPAGGAATGAAGTAGSQNTIVSLGQGYNSTGGGGGGANASGNGGAGGAGGLGAGGGGGGSAPSGNTGGTGGNGGSGIAYIWEW